ncbi:hypothetical protein CSOJ01_01345 [Colletotrichum sojae]|uniref:Uncharacterized protein n=1 Tax=Colletotrichum sojae TaxID=2175907 RepID=A0A8H6N4H9_9PEZI|nr:hypothetical protein CSOJ01_01345 [Colletotrichum sojae]
MSIQKGTYLPNTTEKSRTNKMTKEKEGEGDNARRRPSVDHDRRMRVVNDLKSLQFPGTKNVLYYGDGEVGGAIITGREMARVFQRELKRLMDDDPDDTRIYVFSLAQLESDATSDTSGDINKRGVDGGQGQDGNGGGDGGHPAIGMGPPLADRVADTENAATSTVLPATEHRDAVSAASNDILRQSMDLDDNVSLTQQNADQLASRQSPDCTARPSKSKAKGLEASSCNRKNLPASNSTAAAGGHKPASRTQPMDTQSTGDVGARKRSPSNIESGPVAAATRPLKKKKMKEPRPDVGELDDRSDVSKGVPWRTEPNVDVTDDDEFHTSDEEPILAKNVKKQPKKAKKAKSKGKKLPCSSCTPPRPRPRGPRRRSPSRRSCRTSRGTWRSEDVDCDAV